MVGEINISFVKIFHYSKSVHPTPAIIEYDARAKAPQYILIIESNAYMALAQFWISKENPLQ